MPEPGSKGTQATKPCDPLRFVSDCAPESSAFFWPPHSRMAAIAFSCGHYEKLLGRGKRATS